MWHTKKGLNVRAVSLCLSVLILRCSMQTHSHITEKPRAAEYQEQNWAGNTDEHWASRAPADRGRGSVPPWTATDGCRQAKCINTTGDPCLHHLHLFLEPLHPPLFFLSLKLPLYSRCYLKCKVLQKVPHFFFLYFRMFYCDEKCDLCLRLAKSCFNQINVTTIYLQRWTIM